MKHTHLAKILLPFLVGSYAGIAQAEQKALLVGIDGTQFERVQALNTPNFDRLTITQAYTGGVAGDSNEQATYSGPGWATILTGVWVNKHGVTSNDSGLANPEFPSIFKRLEAHDSTLKVASIAHWSPINTQFFTNDVAQIDVVKSGQDDPTVVSEAIQFMQSGGDFTFVHLDDPDHYGHSSGFGSQYDNSIITVDQQLGQLLDAVEALEESTGDDWLVMVTTDHGRDLLGYGHGDQTTQEKTIFIASNKLMNKEFTQPVGNVANSDFGGLYGYAAQTSITPTLLRHMGVPLETHWKLDGIPLIDELGVRKLANGINGNDLSWYSEEAGTINIYRNESLVDSVPAAIQGWDDATNNTGVLDYTLVLNNTPVSYRKVALDITAGLDWSDFRAYFFRNDEKYVRYAKVLDKADSGYPKVTNNDTWPGLGDHADKVVASFKSSSSTSYFFLKDGTYIRYNNTLDKADSGYPKPINDNTWPGLGNYATDIAATLRWTGDKVYFFLKNGDYIRYDLGDDKADSGYPKAVNDNTWPGLGAYATDITAAVQWNSNRAYIFLTGQRYIRYSISDDHADAGYPKTTSNGTWPGLMTP
ncbi:alkaline phosphatase family protein [Litoribrevibacter albus]|uniref:Metalloenzyme domain-containing protein n=1 Tax=Litoribrevibacter albus TaxID=1473156 RepID=A0AA37SAR6_9GAMM|nr:alkaline phosphatase family protein [Litoribrevibacter albus]GLQ31756.1 hypothetical protein GCM10007876_22350 [Litoribrevibacter albus]